MVFFRLTISGGLSVIYMGGRNFFFDVLHIIPYLASCFCSFVVVVVVLHSTL